MEKNISSAVFLIASILSISFIEARDKKGVVLIGGGGGSKVHQMDRYRMKGGDLKLEASVYGIEPKAIMYLNHGAYMGLEVNEYTMRPYMGFSELLLGMNVKMVPICYFGISAGAVLDLSTSKEYFADFGIEASVWIGTLIGTLKLTERAMAQEFYQTRLDYLLKIPIFGDPSRRER